MRIVLASQSPRRKALLSALGISFDIISSKVEEVFDGRPEEMVVTNARAKRDDVAKRLDFPALIIAADTLVFSEGRPMGKPSQLVEARKMLAYLSGRTHQVLTGLSVLNTETGASSEGYESTDVTFRKLTADEIDKFVRAVNPIDRAGAYTVDGPGTLLIERYEGCYQNVLGLPIVRLERLLHDLEMSLFNLMDGENAVFL